MTDNDLAGSTPPDEEPPLSRQQEPGTSTPAGDPSRAAPDPRTLSAQGRYRGVPQAQRVPRQNRRDENRHI